MSSAPEDKSTEAAHKATTEEAVNKALIGDITYSRTELLRRIRAIKRKHSTSSPMEIITAYVSLLNLMKVLHLENKASINDLSVGGKIIFNEFEKHLISAILVIEHMISGTKAVDEIDE